MAHRLIRDDVLDSERVHKLAPAGRWLYVALLLLADDVGLLELNSFKIGRKSGIEAEEQETFLRQMIEVDLIRPYTVAKKRYAFIPRFKQRLQIKRSKCPMPPAEILVDDPDALNKIKALEEAAAVAHRKSTVGQPPEPEPEPEEEQEKETTPKGKSVVPAAAAPAPTKGRRLPVEWVLPKAWGEWALADRPGWTADTVRLEASKFADHWHAKSGKDAAKVDWLATWRNWCRNARVSPPVRGSPQPADTAARNAEARRLLGFQPGPEPLDA